MQLAYDLNFESGTFHINTIAHYAKKDLNAVAYAQRAVTARGSVAKPIFRSSAPRLKMFFLA